MHKGNVFIISGPSGSGKDTILHEVLQARPDMFFSISSITRAMRAGEVAGEKYNFISVDAFESGLANHAFLEYNQYLGNYYGTPRQPVDDHVCAGIDVMIEVDVNGAASIKQKLPDAISVFVMPPSFAVLKERLSGRGTETAEQIEKRLNAAMDEIRRATEYDYVVVNDDLSEAIQSVLTVIDAQQFRMENMKKIIYEVLQNA